MKKNIRKQEKVGRKNKKLKMMVVVVVVVVVVVTILTYHLRHCSATAHPTL
jgi:flagellar basal body-associated protein FliL